MTVQKIPEGFATITPSLMINGAAEAIDLYKKAFGATEEYRMPSPDGSGRIMHACIKIGSSKLFLADTSPDKGSDCATPSKSGFYLYFTDADAACAQAKKAGLEEKMPPADMFWGDRMGAYKDKFGISWTLATHVKDVSEDEMKEGAKQFAQQMSKNKAA